MNEMIKQEVLAAVQERKVLDLDKDYSYAVNSGAINAYDEGSKAIELPWLIKNRTESSQFLVISSLFEEDKNNTIFGTIREALTACVPSVAASRVHAFQSGDIYVTPGVGNEAKKLSAESLDGSRDIEQFLRYVGKNPTRLIKMRLSSTTAANAPDMSNIENSLKTMFFSPFDPPVEKRLGLSNLINQAFLTNNILDVNFVDQAFPVILSNEHFFILQINPGTDLKLNVFVGAQDSKAQRFWRRTRQAADLKRNLGIRS